MKTKCRHGVDRTLWRDLPPEFPGAYIVTKCTACGGIVGRRPPGDEKSRRRAKSEDNSHVANVDQLDEPDIFGA